MENKKIIHYKRIDSTNTKIQELAAQGAEHGTVVVAEEQTAGKGRRGRSWESPSGDNIYMSILLRPEITPEKAPMLTLVMAYSAAKAIQMQGFTGVQIKWPNDLVLSGKKICGILTEMSLSGTKIDHVVIGVGVNVNTTDFSQELSEKATSLYLECGKKISKQELTEAILAHFEKDYEAFLKKEDLSFMQDTYNRLLINREKEVRVLEPGHEYAAFAKGINENGELLVKTTDGEEKAIFAGEVSVRGVYGYI